MFLTIMNAFKNPKKRRHLIIAILVFVAADVMLGALYAHGGKYSFVDIGYMKFAFYNLPFILLTGLYGLVPSIFMLLGLFVYAMLTNLQQAYLFFPYLLAAFVVYFPARLRWFRRKSLTVLAAILLTLSLGNSVFFVMAFANPIGFYYTSAFGQLVLFLSELPECSIAVCLLYIFYNKTPENLRSEFRCARFYTKEYDLRVVSGTQEKATKLGTHALLILLANISILVVTSIIVTMNLFDLYAISSGLSDEAILSNDVDTTIWKQRVIQDITEGMREVKANDPSAILIPEIRFMKHLQESYRNGMPPDVTASSLLRQLSMMLIMIIVPLLVISNSILQDFALTPVARMERFMTGYVETEETKRKEFIANVPDFTPIKSSEIYQLQTSLMILVRDVERYIDTIQRQRTVEDNLRIQGLAAEAKSTFLANMSNQIRPSINSILVMNTMIMNSTQEVETKAFSRDIRNAAKTLMNVVNDILDYAKIETGSLEIVPVQYDLHTTIRTIHDMVHVPAEEKELSLKYEIDENLPSMLIGDEIRIRQCLMNLMTNAVNNTREGSVTFSVVCERLGQTECYLTFTIIDTGVGMSDEKVRKLLNARIATADTTNLDIANEGLGMSIVNYLLESMGAQLHIRSIPGEGTEVSFRIMQKVENWTPAEVFSIRR